jgi:hypothetical protein
MKLQKGTAQSSWTLSETLMEEDRVAKDHELEIFHRIPPSEENIHFVIGRSCRCRPTLEIVDEKTVIVDHKRIAVMEAGHPH